MLSSDEGLVAHLIYSSPLLHRQRQRRREYVDAERRQGVVRCYGHAAIAEMENMMGSRWQDAETQNRSQANPGCRPKGEIEVREMAPAHSPQFMSRAMHR